MQSFKVELQSISILAFCVQEVIQFCAIGNGETMQVFRDIRKKIKVISTLVLFIYKTQLMKSFELRYLENVSNWIVPTKGGDNKVPTPFNNVLIPRAVP